MIIIEVIYFIEHLNVWDTLNIINYIALRIFPSTVENRTCIYLWVSGKLIWFIFFLMPYSWNIFDVNTSMSFRLSRWCDTHVSSGVTQALSTLVVMWCCRRHHASPVPYPSTRREGTGSMGVLCLGGNRVWETHLYGHIGYFTWVVDLTSGASPLFWYLLQWRLVFIFVNILTSGASPFLWDFPYEGFVNTCMQRISWLLENGKA